MKLVTVVIPESITGTSPSLEINLTDKFNDVIKSLKPLFSCVKKNGPIRQMADKPDGSCSTIELELWQFNEELTKLTWHELTVSNATLLLANYSLLEAEEKLSFQPFLWAYILCGTQWCSVYSNVMASFLNERNYTSTTLWEICSVNQRNSVILNLKKLHNKFSSGQISLRPGEGFEYSEEAQTVLRVLQYWEGRNPGT